GERRIVDAAGRFGRVDSEDRDDNGPRGAPAAGAVFVRIRADRAATQRMRSTVINRPAGGVPPPCFVVSSSARDAASTGTRTNAVPPPRSGTFSARSALNVR